MLEHDVKKTSIFDLPKRSHWEYDFIGDSDFKLPFSDEIIAQIANYYAEYAGGPVYDNPAACLSHIEDVSQYTTKLSFELGSFYDFLLANVIGREVQGNNDRLLRAFSAAGASPEVMQAVQSLGLRFKEARKSIRSVKDCVNQTLLPNMVAISILVHDGRGNYLVSQRTGNVVIGKNLGGVTSTGTLETIDVFAASKKNSELDPFCACAQRELMEETEFNLPAEAFTTRGLFVGQAKLQPIAIVDVLVDRDLSRYSSWEPCGSKEPQPELKKITSIKKEKLQSIVFKYDMTEASSYHMLMHVYDDDVQ